MGFLNLILIALMFILVVAAVLIFTKLQSIPCWIAKDEQSSSELVYTVLQDVSQTSQTVHQLGLQPTVSNLVLSLQLISEVKGKLAVLLHEYPRSYIVQQSRLADPDQLIDMIQHQQLQVSSMLTTILSNPVQ
jgi:hypothetical protein